MLKISDIRTQCPTDRAKTGDIGHTWLVDQDALNGIAGQVIFDFFKEPGAEIFVIETGHIMRTPMTILDLGLRMAEGVPARHERGAGEKITEAAKADMEFQTGLVCLTHPAFQVTWPA